MANCTDYNCSDPLGLHLLNDCGDELQGGVKDAIILECDTLLTDPSSASEIAAEIAAGRATLVKNIKIGMPAASPVNIASNVACSTDKLVTYDRTLTWMDGNINDNNITEFYNNLLAGQSKGGLIIHECGADQVTWINDEVRMTGSRIIPDSDNEFQRFECTVTWRNKYDSSIYTTPVGTFD